MFNILKNTNNLFLDLSSFAIKRRGLTTPSSYLTNTIRIQNFNYNLNNKYLLTCYFATIHLIIFKHKILIFATITYTFLRIFLIFFLKISGTPLKSTVIKLVVAKLVCAKRLNEQNLESVRQNDYRTNSIRI